MNWYLYLRYLNLKIIDAEHKINILAQIKWEPYKQNARRFKIWYDI